MAVTFLDAPGKVLESTSEALDFSVTDPTLVVAISVGFGASRVEERVWRDGAFLYPYLASTRSLGVFAVRREGGWPLNPTLYVDEAGLSQTVVIDNASNRVVDNAGNTVVP